MLVNSKYYGTIWIKEDNKKIIQIIDKYFTTTICNRG